MKMTTMALVAGLLLMIVVPVVGAPAVAAALFNGGAGVAASSGPDAATDAIPPLLLVTYQAAATVCPGLSWTVLAAIGTVESDNDQSNLPGVHSGHNSAGAEGPMQFEPATFAQYDRPDPPGGVAPPTPYDPVDAVYAAARLLCANGAAEESGLGAAVYTYNHSNAYVDQVLQLAAQYAAGSVDAGPSGAAVAVAFALSQIGTPYRWGAESPGVAFDCSGLVQAAWAAAGVPLPRVAQAQFDAGPLLAPGAPLQPGDLVFFGADGGGVTHVGLVVDGSGPKGEMVDAPHTGASVRVEPFPLTVGSAWGGDILVGATRPGLQ
jgi:cell wall-associated NlpC family hydrolase